MRDEMGKKERIEPVSDLNCRNDHRRHYNRNNIFESPPDVPDGLTI